MQVIAQRRARLTQLKDYVLLIKVRQTALLLITGFCAYTLAQGLPLDPLQALWMMGAMFFSISGCTALNMFLDRDIDARMSRTAGRPLPSGRLAPAQVWTFGALLSLLGLALALALDLRFGLLAALGFAVDLLVYSLWLKRRTPLSIMLGGISGGMPILAGRALALGRVDLLGLLMACSVLFWIPSHNLTLATHYAADYRRAGVPVWPNVYGLRATQRLIAQANLLNTLVLVVCAFLLQVRAAALGALLGMSLGICALSVRQWLAPTQRRNWLLFKLASLYMLAALLLLVGGAL
jgi:protoheme IX farnesyltransferase